MTAGVVGIGNALGHSRLAALAWAWRDVQQVRLAQEQRGLDAIAGQMAVIERALAGQVTRELRKHELWPWLSRYAGLGGVHVARLIALIDDPHRFPGRPCSAGHIVSAAMTAALERSTGGEVCGQERFDGPCAGTLESVRRGTGTRSLWHYLGLHVVDGLSPRKVKGQQADWNPIGRTICLQPKGLAEQIVLQRTPVYRELYDATKDRLTRERGADKAPATDTGLGSAFPDGPEAESPSATDVRVGLRPVQIEGIARKVAVKAFVADLLAEWKRLRPIDLNAATEASTGRAEVA